jgi:hypothetical protein
VTGPMRFSRYAAQILVIFALIGLATGTYAQPKLSTRIDVSSDDDVAKYQVTKQLLDAINASRTHTQSNDLAAARHIHVAIAKVTNGGNVVGNAVAFLVTKGPSEQREIVTFSNQFVPSGQLEATIKAELPNLLR